MAASNRITYIVSLIIIVIILFQIIKLTNYQANSSFDSSIPDKYKKLVYQTPVYKDSLYTIYIASIKNVPSILYLKKHNIEDVQLNSKFFLHVYPMSKSLLTKGTNLLAYDFKVKPIYFSYKNVDFFLFSTELPSLKIEKINTGQYGYKGNNDISWRINSLLRWREIKTILAENKERDIKNFNISDTISTL